MPRNILEDLKEKGVAVEETLERFMRDEVMYEKFLRKFPNEQTMKVLKEAIAGKDYDSAHEALHALKGIADNLGFTDFVQVAVKMLAEFRSKNPQGGMALFPELLQKYEEICTTITEAL